jgi:xylulokinase
MSDSLKWFSDDTVLVGCDFSTGSVKAIAFDLNGKILTEVRLPTDLYLESGVSELGITQLEGQTRSVIRSMSRKLADLNRLQDWKIIGISATHHTSGRIDAAWSQVRRAICWNDQTLAKYHSIGLERLGGQAKVRELIGGPWAVRYSLTHLVKDEQQLPVTDWNRTWKIVSHGSLAAGYMSYQFNHISVSSAASTGLMDLRTNQWSSEMLNAIQNPVFRKLAFGNLPKIMISPSSPEYPAYLKNNAPHYGVGSPYMGTAFEAQLFAGKGQNIHPRVYPTLDDQAAGLIGGGAVNPGQVAIILGNSAVVNSSAASAPTTDNLDAMKLNWGPYLWMRCYSNGAQFLDRVLGSNPNWEMLERQARTVDPTCNSIEVMPFVLSEPSIGVEQPRFEWLPSEPTATGIRYRASLEAIAYLVTLGVEAHEDAGQEVNQITVSGGIAKSPLMVEILASVLNFPIQRLQSDEGPALGAAVAALADAENGERFAKRATIEPELYPVEAAVKRLVKFREPVLPNPKWVEAYQEGLNRFKDRLGKN